MSRRKPRIKLPLTIQCNCCDYVTLREQGANEVCPVCFWEDDGLGLDKICQPSHSNDNLTLLQARKNYKNLEACNTKWLTKVCSSQERNNFERLSRQSAALIFEIAEAAAKRGIACCRSHPYIEKDDEMSAYDVATEKSGFLSYEFSNHGLTSSSGIEDFSIYISCF
jgi:hypothetical protein